MEKIVKAIKIGGEINTFIGNILDPIIERIEFTEEFDTFLRKYAHEHPEEIDNINSKVKLSCSLTIDPLKESGGDLKTNVEAIVKKRLQSGEDEILFKKECPQPKEDYLEVDELEHN